MDNDGDALSVGALSGRKAGQRVDLLDTLRGLVRDYPADLGVVKELLQNADDAGATWLELTLDRQTHSAEVLPDPRMAERGVMGPALLARSDQVFSKLDLERINHIGAGSKTRDTGKTGQFGKGFNTVYSLSDYPAFATCGLVRCYDPLKDAVAADDEPGREWDLAELWAKSPGWPLAFGLKEGVSELKETVFRLPLRTHLGEHRLGQRPISAKDVHNIFEQVRCFGAALLLFVRRVLALKLRVLDEDGNEEVVFEIRTENMDDVRAAREALNRVEVEDPAETLKNWRSTRKQPPVQLYQHHFALRGAESDREIWWVAQAFKPGPEVLEAAELMAGIEHVALPRVGAALPLDSSGEALAASPCAGHLFCTLPLPDPSGLPLHLNGFFDLDTSRRTLSHGSRGGDAAVRVAWNRALLHHSIPAIARRLLDAMPAAWKEARPERVFGLWPKPPHDEQLREAAKGLSLGLAELPFLRVRGAEGGRWCVAEEVRRSGTRWSKELRGALQVDGVELTDPELPETVVASLREIGALPAPYEPDDLRNLLTTDYSGPIGDAPLCCLRDRGLILQLVRFFLREKSADLEGLALLLGQDGTLRAFARKRTAWAAGEAIREILEPWSCLLLDSELQGLLEARPAKGMKPIKVTPTALPATLLQIQERLGTQEGRRWSIEPGADLSQDWIERTVLFIGNNAPQGSKEALCSLRIVPDRNGDLYALLSPETPHPLAVETPKVLSDSLDSLGVPLVLGEPGLVQALKYLDKKLDGEALPSLGKALVERICKDQGVTWASLKKTTRELLLDTLAEENDKGALAGSLVTRLAQVSIWPTQSGELQAAQDEGVFLPADFKPPRIGRGVVFFQTGQDNRWQKLLHRCGARYYREREYLNQVVLREFFELESDEQDKVITWLAAGSLVRQLHGSDKANDRTLFDALRSASIVRCTDGALKAPTTVYHPESKAVHSLLGGGVAVPRAENDNTKERILALFMLLGMARQPRPADLLALVQALMEASSTEGLGAVVGKVNMLAQHLCEYWEELREESIDGISLQDHLKELAWLPALSPTGETNEPAGLKVPDERLYHAAELFLVRRKHLVASQEPLCDLQKVSYDFQKALGVQDEVPLATVLNHFRCVRDVVIRSELVPASQVAQCASALYRFLGESKRGEEAENASSSALDLNTALKSLRKECCIWDVGSNSFLHPKHTFSVPVPFFGTLRAQIEAEGPEAEGLNLLGRRGPPELEDYRSYLDDLAVESRGRPLLEDEKESALYSIKQIGALLSDANHLSSVHLLDHKDHLRKSDRVLRDDAPWWRNRMANGPVAMVGKEVPRELALKLEVPTASETLCEKLSGRSNHLPTEDCEALCEALQARVHHAAFLQGLRRMIFFEHQVLDPELSRIAALRFEPSGPLLTVLTGAPLDPDERFGEEEVEVFLEDEVLRIAGGELDDVLPWAAVAIARCLKKEQRLANKAPLEEMLRTKDAQDIPKVLKRRRIPELPGQEDESETRWDNTVEPLPDSPVAESSRDFGAAIAGDPAPQSGEGSPGGNRDGFVLSASTNAPWERSPSGGDRPQRNQSTSTMPPSRPGDGSSNYVSGRGGKRLRSYAQPPTATLSHGSKEEREAVKRASIRHIYAYEQDRGTPEPQITEVDEANEVYDLIVCAPNSEPARFVAVKGLDATWAARGVALTSAQVAEAVSRREQYWLYVVEYALDEHHAQVHAIQDPVGKLDQLFFDGGWVVAAEGAEVVPAPEEGDKVWLGEKLLGEIIEVHIPSEDGMTATQLTLRRDDGSESLKTWSSSRMRLDKED